MEIQRNTHLGACVCKKEGVTGCIYYKGQMLFSNTGYPGVEYIVT